LIFVTFAALAVPAVRAQVTEIYKCVEPNGRPLYTSDKRETTGKKCELVSREVNVAPAPKAQAGKPTTAFPKETASQRASARDRQREILQKELLTEEGLLAKARQDLAEQESVRTGDERNFSKALERLQPFRDSVETHQKNIESLRRELANLSR
jgi:hypothetical protein